MNPFDNDETSCYDAVTWSREAQMKYLDKGTTLVLVDTVDGKLVAIPSSDANADHIRLAMAVYDKQDGGVQSIAVTLGRVGSHYRAMIVNWNPTSKRA